jgi:hypothetical protein
LPLFSLVINKLRRLDNLFGRAPPTTPENHKSRIIRDDKNMDVTYVVASLVFEAATEFFLGGITSKQDEEGKGQNCKGKTVKQQTRLSFKERTRISVASATLYMYRK